MGCISSSEQLTIQYIEYTLNSIETDNSSFVIVLSSGDKLIIHHWEKHLKEILDLLDSLQDHEIIPMKDSYGLYDIHFKPIGSLVNHLIALGMT